MVGSVAMTMACLIAAGVASRGRPLSTRGWSASGLATDVLLAATFGLVALLFVVLAVESRRPGSTARRAWGVGDVLFAVVLVAALTAGAYGVGRVFHSSDSSSPNGVSCTAYERAHGGSAASCAGGEAAPVARRARTTVQRGPGTPWAAIGGIVALLVVGSALLALGRRAAEAPEEPDAERRDAILGALEFSIDDLRRERDPARAVVAAYARMERALAAAGSPRAPAEAPREFLLRSLRRLDVSAASAARLTDLFELAKFSHHVPTPAMRDESIKALVTVRDELTAHRSRSAD